MQLGTRAMRSIRFTVALLCNLAAWNAHSQQAEAPAEAAASATARYSFEIPAKSLLAALTDFTEITGVQLLYPSGDGLDVAAQAVSGSYTVDEALRRMLGGTGLTFRFINARTVTLEKAPKDARVLGPVRVQGAAVAGVAGINGSTDPTATEGTKSYTSSALSIASKTPQSIKDTPQSVSVVTQQRMQDQNLTDFTSVMNQTTGVTLVTNSTLQTTFYSRGFAINSIQIDGGAPLSMTLGKESDGTGNNYYPQIDMAMYDHVEILRGADGLFNGYGTPSGSVNLTRKRPLDHVQAVIEGQAGSWDNYRTVIDATSPLGFDGKLRGRAVMSYQDQDYFYDVANNSKTLAYGILEADFTPSTLVSAGFSHTRQDAVPQASGLPRYQNGADLQLSRSTSFALPWNRWSFETTEIFAQLEQHFGDDWSAKLNLTRNDQESHPKYGYVNGAVNPTTGQGPRLSGFMYDYSSLQTLVDFTVNGAFELFGHRQQVVFGGNWQDVDSGGYRGYGSLYPSSVAIDIFSFDLADPVYREPSTPELSVVYPEYGQKQWGAYASLRLTLWEPLHLITGLRYSRYEFNTAKEDYCTSLDISYGNCSNVGEVYSASRKTYGDHDISWPPTVSLVYDLRPNWSAYASYTDIYQAQADAVGRDHKPIDPITGSNIEAGLKVERFAGKLNATLAAYRIEQKNFNVYAGEFIDLGNEVYCCYLNGNRVNLSRGLDAEVTGEVLPGWQIFAGYTYNINEIKGSDYYDSNYGEGYDGPALPLISRVPKHLLKLWTSYQFQRGEVLRRLNVGGGVSAQTASYQSGTACTEFTTNSAGNNVCVTGKNLPYEYTQGFYAVLSTRVAYQLDPHWSVALNVSNLTDRTYYQTMGSSTSGNWYGEPRSLMLTLRGTF